MWGWSGSILRTNNYDPNTDTAFQLLINTSAKGNVRLSCVAGDERMGVEQQEEQPVSSEW